MESNSIQAIMMDHQPTHSYFPPPPPSPQLSLSSQQSYATNHPPVTQTPLMSGAATGEYFAPPPQSGQAAQQVPAVQNMNNALQYLAVHSPPSTPPSVTSIPTSEPTKEPSRRSQIAAKAKKYGGYAAIGTLEAAGHTIGMDPIKNIAAWTEMRDKHKAAKVQLEQTKRANSSDSTSPATQQSQAAQSADSVHRSTFFSFCDPSLKCTDKIQRL